MKVLKSSLFILLFTLASFGQQVRSSNVTGQKVLGNAVADQFDQWTLQSNSRVTVGTGAVQVNQALVVSPNGVSFNPIANGSPIFIEDGPASETVTASGVNCSQTVNTCTFTATFSNNHLGQFKVRSGSRGLQEAINFQTTTGGSVIVTSDWQGTTSMIINALGSTSVSVIDLRLGNVNIYTWSGSNYAVTLGTSAAGGITLGNQSNINNVRYCNAFTGVNAGAKIIACIADGPSSGVIADARGIEGNQTIAADMFNGVTKPGELWLGSATYTLSSYQQIPSGWKIRCTQGTVLNVPSDLPPLPDLTLSATAAFYVKKNSTDVTIEGCKLTGPFVSGAGGHTFGLYAGDGSSNVRFINNNILSFSWSGIHLFTGTRFLVQGNYTEHNAVDGIESWATDSIITKNRSFNDGASASGTACIEIIGRQTSPAVVTSDGTIVEGNECVSSNSSGIQLSNVGAGNTHGVSVRGNYITNSAGVAINVQSGHQQVSIEGNVVDTTLGSGALGRGIFIADCDWFSIHGNNVRHLTVGSGPNAIEVGGSCKDGEVTNNVIDDVWVGIVIADTAGTGGNIIVNNNTVTNPASGVPYLVTSSGTHISAPFNSFNGVFVTKNMGTTTNDNASPGEIGEYVSASLGVGSAVSLTTDTTANVTSITLTPGDWDVTAEIDWSFAAATSFTILQSGITQTSTTLGARGTVNILELPATVPSHNTDMEFTLPTVRFSIASPITVYLVARATFSVDTLSAYGSIRARRVR